MWDVLTSPGAIGGYIAGAFAFLLGHLWTRYVNRLIRVRWQVTHLQSMASSHRPMLGRVDVHYNDKPVPFLHSLVLEIENESGSRDLTDLEFALVVGEGFSFAGNWESSGATTVPFSPAFREVLSRVVELDSKNETIPADDTTYINQTRGFVIPVLNRGTAIRFVFLVVSTASGVPPTTFYCERAGVRTKERKSATLFWGVPQGRAVLAGHVLAIPFLVWISLKFPGSGWLPVVGFIAGDLVLAWGAIALLLRRRVERVLG